MKLLVKMLTGFSFTVDDLEAMDSIHELKGRVYEREGYLPESQRIADGASKSSLDNDVTLEEAGFKDGDTAHLLVAVEALKEEGNKDQPIPDWRRKKSHEQRVKHLLDTGLCYDVLLQVQKPNGEWEDIRAHRAILTQASSVFETLCEPTAKRPHPRVKVTDMSSELLWQILRSIYCGPLKLDVTNVVRLYQAAVTYRLTEIIDKCQAYMTQSLDQWSSGELLTLLDTLTTKEHEDLAHTIVSHISKNMKQYIHQPEFKGLSRHSLTWIVKSGETFGCSELELYRACVGWARAQCDKDGVEATGPACRQALGDCLLSIHFPAMAPEEFAEVSTGVGILTGEERADIYDYLVLKGDVKIVPAFPVKARRRRTVREFMRFSGTPAGGWGTDGDEAIDFQVDKPIELTAISTYGVTSAYEQCGVEIEMKDANGTVIGRCSSLIPSSVGAEIQQLQLDQPVSLKANVKYRLHIKHTVKGVKLYYGEGGYGTYTVGGDCGVKINVYNSGISQGGTEVYQGQLPGFHFI